MPRFSIIIPVYNTSKYLKKCLDSVFNQGFKNYEVIVVNDGSTDNSSDIISQYIDKIIYIDQENKGLSSARNVGISRASGEYLLFLDSDDFYEPDFLEKLDLEINDEDIIRYGLQDVFDDLSVKKYSDKSFLDVDGVSAFNMISGFHYVEVSCLYCYKRKFWIDNNFSFRIGTYHEDFGLIPLVIIKALSVKCINLVGYNYYQRSGSITNDNNYSKTVAKANDFLTHFKYLIKESKSVNGNLSIFISYIANCVILKATTLKGNDYKKYIKELRKLGVFDMILSDTLFRKIKKRVLMLSPKLYYKIVR